MSKRLFAIAIVSLMLGACSSSSSTTPFFPQHLYVAKENTTLLVYTLPITSASTPVVTLGGFVISEAAALDSLGHVFVSDQGTTPVQVDEFNLPLSASSLPIATIKMPASTDARALAVDASNNLWVPSLDGHVYEFVGPFSGTVTPAPNITLTSGLNGPEGLTFDSLGNLYVVNNGGTTVAIFNAPQTNLMAVSGTLSGISGNSRGIAIDRAGHVYVQEGGGNIDRFNGPPPFVSGTAPSFTDPSATTGLSFAGGQAVDTTGNLYACDFTLGLFVFANAQSTFSATSAPSANVPGKCSNIVAGP
jgi:sugar lactone lactonase YvrE